MSKATAHIATPTGEHNPIGPSNPQPTTPARQAVRRLFGASVVLQRLNDDLQGDHQRASRSFDKIEADMAEQAAASMAKVRATGVAKMLENPWRIVRAINPNQRAVWPMVDDNGNERTAVNLLAECRTRIANERSRAGHWTADGNRLIALQQAEAALVLIVAGSEAGR